MTIAICDRLAAPLLVGIVRPMILLPPAALTGWSPEELEMVLLHELAHVRRWDNLVNLVVAEDLGEVRMDEVMRVLCPGGVATQIGSSERNRPDTLRSTAAAPAAPAPDLDEMREASDRNILEPADVADRVLDAVREERFWVITHPEWGALVAPRHREIEAAFEIAAALASRS